MSPFPKKHIDGLDMFSEETFACHCMIFPYVLVKTFSNEVGIRLMFGQDLNYYDIVSEDVTTRIPINTHQTSQI